MHFYRNPDSTPVSYWEGWGRGCAAEILGGGKSFLGSLLMGKGTWDVPLLLSPVPPPAWPCCTWSPGCASPAFPLPGTGVRSRRDGWASPPLFLPPPQILRKRPTPELGGWGGNELLGPVKASGLGGRERAGGTVPSAAFMASQPRSQLVTGFHPPPPPKLCLNWGQAPILRGVGREGGTPPLPP